MPHLDVPDVLKPPLWVLMFFIEVAGLLIRHVVLAVRLFANMFAGHVVLSVILGFTLMAVVVDGVLAGDAGERRRRDLPEPPRAVRRVLAGVHFYLLVGAVHRVGGPSPLIGWPGAGSAACGAVERAAARIRSTFRLDCGASLSPPRVLLFERVSSSSQELRFR